jgi:hypothetical protein
MRARTDSLSGNIGDNGELLTTRGGGKRNHLGLMLKKLTATLKSS